MLRRIANWLHDVGESGRSVRTSPITARVASRGRPFGPRLALLAVLAGPLLALLAVDPVAAESPPPVCSADSGTLPSLIEGFIQLTTALGLLGLLAVWQADTITDRLVIGIEGQRRLTQQKLRTAKRSATLVILGTLLILASQLNHLLITHCTNPVPF